MGDNEIAILGLLAEKPRYGYELDKVIEQRGTREWTDIAFSSIYAVLRGLEQKGMVFSTTEVAGNRVRKLFTITKDGKRTLRESIENIIAKPARTNDRMMLALAYAGVLSGDDTNQAFAARLRQLEEAKSHLSAKFNENAKSSANVKQMFERSAINIEAEIKFAEGFLGEVASAPVEPRNDGTTRPAMEEKEEMEERKEIKVELKPEAKPEPKLEQKPEAKPEERKEPMGTLF